MGIFNVKEATEQSLRLLEKNGASAKTLKGYRNTGFGAIIRYFSHHGTLDVSASMIDGFVLEQRRQFDKGKFSEWKWQLVRRAGELLKHYAETGTVEMPAVKPWEPVLRKPRQIAEANIPASEQLADPDNIFALVWRTEQELHKMGLSKSAIRHYSAGGFAVILRKHSGSGLELYSESLVSGMVSEIRSGYENGEISRVTYQNLRKASFLLSEMHRTGKVTLSPVPNWNQREPKAAFSNLLWHFCDNAIQTGILSESSVKSAKSAIRTFLFELESHGLESFDGITLAEVSDTITHIAKRYTGGLHSAISSVRLFLRYLFENGFSSEDLNLAVPEMIARRKVFREGFTDDEIGRLLSVPDRNIAIGKRDYAHDAILCPMRFGSVHGLLLLVQHPDGRKILPQARGQQRDVRPLQHCVDMAQVSPDIAKLFSDCAANLFLALFAPLDATQKVPSSGFAIGARFDGISRLAMQQIDNLLQLLTRIVQQAHIRGIGDVRGRAGRIQYQHSAAASIPARCVVVIVIIVELRLLRSEHHFIDLSQDLRGQPFAEIDHRCRGKRRCRREFVQSDEVLDIHVLQDHLHCFLVRQPQLLLDQQCAQCHPHRFRHIPRVRLEQRRIALFYPIPRNQRRFLYPAIVFV